MDQDTVIIDVLQHRFPKKMEKWLPKFDPDKKQQDDDHINFFIQVVK